MSDMTAYLWGVASVLMLESVVLMYAIDWLKKRAKHEKENS